MAGWKEFAFEWRQRDSAYPVATVDHIAIYGDKSRTLHTIDDVGNPAHHHMGHLECISGATSWRGDPSNEAWGQDALRNITLGVSNLAIGNSSLAECITGSGNVAIGNYAGFYETGSNKFYIANTPGTSADALIYGEFNLAHRKINFNNTNNSTTTSFVSIPGIVVIGTSTTDIAGDTVLRVNGQINVTDDVTSFGTFSSKPEVGSDYSNFSYGGITIIPSSNNNSVIHLGNGTYSHGFTVSYTNTVADDVSATINNKPIVTEVAVPAISSSAGTVGQIATDGTYLYICVADNSWKRTAALSTF